MMNVYTQNLIPKPSTFPKTSFFHTLKLNKTIIENDEELYLYETERRHGANISYFSGISYDESGKGVIISTTELGKMIILT